MDIKSMFEQYGLWPKIREQSTIESEKIFLKNIVYVERETPGTSSYEFSKRQVLEKAENIIQRKIQSLIDHNGETILTWRHAHPIQCYQKLLNRFEEIEDRQI